MQIDIGFGDVTPAPENVVPVILDDMPQPQLRVYPRYTVVAESRSDGQARHPQQPDEGLLRSVGAVAPFRIRRCGAGDGDPRHQRRGTDIPPDLPFGSPTNSPGTSEARAVGGFQRKSVLEPMPLTSDQAARVPAARAHGTAAGNVFTGSGAQARVGMQPDVSQPPVRFRRLRIELPPFVALARAMRRCGGSRIRAALASFPNSAPHALPIPRKPRPSLRPRSGEKVGAAAPDEALLYLRPKTAHHHLQPRENACLPFAPRSGGRWCAAPDEGRGRSDASTLQKCARAASSAVAEEKKAPHPRLPPHLSPSPRGEGTSMRDHQSAACILATAPAVLRPAQLER